MDYLTNFSAQSTEDSEYITLNLNLQNIIHPTHKKEPHERKWSLKMQHTVSADDTQKYCPMIFHCLGYSNGVRQGHKLSLPLTQD